VKESGAPLQSRRLPQWSSTQWNCVLYGQGAPSVKTKLGAPRVRCDTRPQSIKRGCVFMADSGDGVLDCKRDSLLSPLGGYRQAKKTLKSMKEQTLVCISAGAIEWSRAAALQLLVQQPMPPHFGSSWTFVRQECLHLGWLETVAR
jgi:hypothetical protein